MNAAPLVERLQSLFARQVAFYDDLLADREKLEANLDREDLSSMMVLEEHRAAEMNALQREQALLMREWAEATPTETEKETVRAIMAEAMERAEKLMTFYEHAIAEVERRKAAIAGQQGELHRGRNMLDRYRPTSGTDPDSFDSKA